MIRYVGKEEMEEQTNKQPKPKKRKKERKKAQTDLHSVKRRAAKIPRKVVTSNKTAHTHLPTFTRDR